MKKDVLDTTWAADFECTGLTNYTIDGKVRCYLWSCINLAGTVKLHGNNIDTFIDLITKQGGKYWFFNLRYDGQFILYAMLKRGWTHGKEFTTSIDKMGLWYEIKIGATVVIWDAVKKFPGCSLNDVAKMYKLEAKKEHEDWNRYIPDDYIPTEKDIEYCIHDSEICAHAIKSEYLSGHTSMTLSSDAFSSIKQRLGWKKWRQYMPLLDKSIEAFVRLAYKGGVVWVKRCYQDVDVFWVKIYDENSAFPWVMRTKPLPIGLPSEREPRPGELYIKQFTTEFILKPNMIPTIQVKGNLLYSETEYIEESIGPTKLTLTNIDYDMFKDHYDIMYEEDIKYLCFESKVGLLADYVDEHMKIKQECAKSGDASGKYIAKRWLNSPYGKTGMRGDRINKIPFMEDDEVSFEMVQTEGDSIYVPYATFVTAWARDNLIRTAQKYYKQLIYMDTDSIHLIGVAEGLPTDKYELGAWDDETPDGPWPTGRYLRPKAYIHGDENRNIKEIKCSGLPVDARVNIKWEDFHLGAEFDGKLEMKTVKGGCLLIPKKYKIKEHLLI